MIAFVVGMALSDHLPVGWLAAAAAAGASCAVGSGAIVFGLVRLERGGRLSVPSHGVSLGQASYAVSLVHFGAMTVVGVALAKLRVAPTDLVCLTAAAAGIAAGLAFDRVVDRPLRRVLKAHKARVIRSAMSVGPARTIADPRTVGSRR